jgi:hypothetical protein
MNQQQLQELIQAQTSYSDLVSWIQQQDHCPYFQACLTLNGALRHYRQQRALAFAAPKVPSKLGRGSSR